MTDEVETIIKLDRSKNVALKFLQLRDDGNSATTFEIPGAGTTAYITGHPGVGKTTFLQSLRYRWPSTGNRGQKLLYFDIRACSEPLKLEDLLKYSDEDNVFNYYSQMIKSSGEGVVLLLDHFTEKLLENLIIYKLLQHEVLPDSSIIVAGQFSALDSLWNDITFPCIYYVIEGVMPGSETDVLECLRSNHKADRITEYIKYNCLEICSIPGIIMMLIDAFRETIPKTYTKMMETLIIKIINNYITEYRKEFEQVKSLNFFPKGFEEQFLRVCEIAYLLAQSNTDTCSIDDLSIMCLGLENTPGKNLDTIGLGLLLPCKKIYRSKIDTYYQFKHGIIQDFLAAYFIATEPLLNQICILHKDGMLKNKNICKFYFGMGSIVNGSKSNLRMKSEVVYAYKPLLENLVHELCIDEELAMKTEKLLFLFQLLHESQDTNLVRKLLMKREKYLKISLEALSIPEPLVMTLAFVMKHSGISKWRIKASDLNVHSADYIARLVHQGKSSQVKIESTDKAEFIVQPLAKSSGSLKISPPVSIYARGAREILHRVLQLHSPIQIKSNSDEPSYVSFLACKCLKDKFEKGLLLIEPIQVIHWIEVPMKRQTEKDGALFSESIELHRHMSKHDMIHLEMVIMMAPPPNRIYYIDPITKEEKPIELCRETKPHSLDGKIALSIKEKIQNEEKSDKCVISTETQPRVLMSEMVNLPLLIPRSDNDLLDYVVVFSKDIDYPQHDNKGTKGACQSEANIGNIQNEKYNVKVSEFDNKERNVKATEFDKSILTELPCIDYPKFNYQCSVKQSVQQSIQQNTSSQKQAAFHPGTILHTTIPHIFALDMRYNIPSENDLIRKGGNGEIYSITYDGIEYAVKKTAYRNREIQIHKKLKHQNIIELSCLMFGSQQPLYRRRYYCYHYMPRMTGDLARMVTDKSELTMDSLSKKYADNPLKLGSMQGNWKYILKEMLKGVGYMHSVKVVHRDMKASNILIKMLCVCDNPLTCNCKNKCLVKIADFDASLELDSSGLLQPSPSITQQPFHHKHQDIYHVRPVGTDGYRAPESAQEIVSNNLSVLMPPVTVKADIWAVGLIVMRMLSGYSGPTKQQQVSFIQVYYSALLL